SKPAPNDQQFDYGPGITNNSSSGLNPATGPAGAWNGGNTVTISGINFGTSPSVTFNGNPATVVQPVTDKQINVIVPPRTGTMSGNQTVPVVVTTAGGQSDGGPAYTYPAPPAPTVSSVTPNTGPVTGTVTPPVTISGSNFFTAPGTQVTVSFGGRAATNVTVVSATTITCSVPQGAMPGRVEVQVIVFGAQSAANANDGYTYTP
ncbi:MAG: hypothetical protein E6G66_16390, partial [Actinobacteria bacterium]